jgi:hypothetical protein
VTLESLEHDLRKRTDLWCLCRLGASSLIAPAFAICASSGLTPNSVALSPRTRRRQPGSPASRPCSHPRPQGFWRYRLGEFRIVAAIEDDRFMVLVVAIGTGERVYR